MQETDRSKPGDTTQGSIYSKKASRIYSQVTEEKVKKQKWKNYIFCLSSVSRRRRRRRCLIYNFFRLNCYTERKK